MTPGSNRTFMELKSATEQSEEDKIHRSNRTFMELKYKIVRYFFI